MIRFAQQAQRTFDALLTYGAVTVALATATLQRADNMQRANLRNATRANVEPCDARLPLCALHLRRPVDPTSDMQPTHETDTLQRAACSMQQHATDNMQRRTTCTKHASMQPLNALPHLDALVPLEEVAAVRAHVVDDRIAVSIERCMLPAADCPLSVGVACCLFITLHVACLVRVDGPLLCSGFQRQLLGYSKGTLRAL